jgi:hypothetical protein
MKPSEVKELVSILEQHLNYFTANKALLAIRYFELLLIAVELDFAGVQEYIPHVKSRHRTLRGELKFILSSGDKPYELLEKLYHPENVVRNLMEKYNFKAPEVLAHIQSKKRKKVIQDIINDDN